MVLHKSLLRIWLIEALGEAQNVLELGLMHATSREAGQSPHSVAVRIYICRAKVLEAGFRVTKVYCRGYTRNVEELYWQCENSRAQGRVVSRSVRHNTDLCNRKGFNWKIKRDYGTEILRTTRA